MIESLNSICPLAIFCGYTARFVSDLIKNPENRFSHDAAYFCLDTGYLQGLNTNILSIEVWETLWFTDPRLVWNTDKCNVGSIRQPQDQIWTPDLEVYHM